MKRLGILSLLLVFLLLSACSATPADLTPLALAHREEATDGTFAGDGIAVGFTLSEPLAGIEFECRITGENPAVTVKIYEANTDYQTTVSAEPVREERITSLSKNLLWQFDTLAAGSYVILFTDMADAVLVKSSVTTAEAGGKILHYRNGNVITEGTLALTLLCPADPTKTPTLTTFTYPVVVEE